MIGVSSSLEGSSVPEFAIPWFIHGRGAAMSSLDATVTQIAPTDIPVLIVGECGTGKDVYARLIHRLSRQKEKTFYRIDCSSFESADSFRQHAGQSGRGQNQEDGDTVYLDSVHDLDLHWQRVLLSRLCQDEDRANLCRRQRLISSTSTNLELEIECGRFRRELYFRINGACIHLLPLRERKDDILALLDYFLRKHGTVRDKIIPPLSESRRELLLAYPWPGNIRELENVALKILTLGERRALDELELDRNLKARPEPNLGGPSLKMAVRAVSQKTERELIIQALERTRWNRKRAAEELRISYKSFLNKLKAIETSSGGAICVKQGK
jgi:DNA-binding NtrC family response regulator